MFCRKCGSVVNSDDDFCFNCGAKIEHPSQPGVTAAAAQPTPPVHADPEPVIEPVKPAEIPAEPEPTVEPVKPAEIPAEPEPTVESAQPDVSESQSSPAISAVQPEAHESAKAPKTDKADKSDKAAKSGKQSGFKKLIKNKFVLIGIAAAVVVIILAVLFIPKLSGSIGGSEYTISSYTTVSSDTLASLTTQGKPIPVTLNASSDKAALSCSDGSSFAELTLNRKDNTGKITYASGSTQDITFTDEDGVFTIVIERSGSEIVFRKKDNLTLPSEGKYAISAYSSADFEDEIENSIFSGGSYPSVLTVGEEGAASISNSDGSAFAELNFDKPGSSSIKYASASEGSLICLVDGDEIILYDTDSRRVLSFVEDRKDFLTVTSGQYHLTDFRSKDDADLLSTTILTNQYLPSSLTLSVRGEGVIEVYFESGNDQNKTAVSTEYLDIKTEGFADLLYDSPSSAFSISYHTTIIDNRDEHPVTVLHTDDTVSIYDGELGYVLKYTRDDPSLFEKLSGNYYLTETFTDKTQTIETVTYTTPVSLTVSADGAGKVMTASPKHEYDFILFENMTGVFRENHTYDSGTYTNVHDALLVPEDDGLTVYTETQVYRFRKYVPDAFAAYIGDNSIMRCTDFAQDSIVHALETYNSSIVATKLTLNTDGTGAIYNNDGTVMAELKYNASDMNGRIKFSNTDKESDVFFIINENNLFLIEPTRCFTAAVIPRGAIEGKTVEGKYTLRETPNRLSTDMIAVNTWLTGYTFPISLDMNADFTGVITYNSGDKLSLTYDPDKHTGTLKTENNKEYNILVSAYDDTFCVYFIERHDYFVFRRQDARVLKPTVGKNKVTEASYTEGKDYLEYQKEKNQSVISKMEMDENYHAKIFTEDGKTWCEFDLDPLTMSGTAKFSNGKEYFIFSRIKIYSNLILYIPDINIVIKFNRDYSS